VRARVFVASLLVLGAAYSGCNCGSPSSRPAIVGVVIDVEAARLGEVESFTLKRGDDTMRIFIDPGASYSFPPPI
jgi:hypothetical protein